jgi:hypothetical protein
MAKGSQQKAIEEVVLSVSERAPQSMDHPSSAHDVADLAIARFGPRLAAEED